MKKLLGIIVLGLLWCNVGFAESKWEIEEGEKSIKVRTEGTTQKGDRLTFWIPKNTCNEVEHTFSFYTAKRVSSIKDIEGKEVVAKTLGKKTLVNLKYIISAKPTMDGDFAFFSLGHYELDKHIEFLEEYKNFDVKLEFIFVDSERKDGWDASDFFDILNNSWNLEGVRLALEDAVSLCEWRIENPLDTTDTSNEKDTSSSNFTNSIIPFLPRTAF